MDPFAEDEVAQADKPADRAGADGVHGVGLKVRHDGARDVRVKVLGVLAVPVQADRTGRRARRAAAAGVLDPKACNLNDQGTIKASEVDEAAAAVSAAAGRAAERPAAAGGRGGAGGAAGGGRRRGGRSGLRWP